MSGEIEVEVSDGKKHAIHAGDIVFLEDLQGKGHITRILIARHQYLHPRSRTALMSSSGRAAKLDRQTPQKAAWRASASHFPIGANAGFPIRWCSRWSGS